MKKFLIALSLLALPALAHAEFFVWYTTSTGAFTRYNPSVDPTNAATGPTETRIQISEGNIPQQLNLLTTVPHKYLKVVGNAVVEMNQTEKDAVDAPVIAAQQLRQSFIDEIVNQEVCNRANLVAVNTKFADVQANITTALNEVDADLDSIPAAITASVNLATARDAMTIMATAQRTQLEALTTSVQELGQVTRQMARCLVSTMKLLRVSP